MTTEPLYSEFRDDPDMQELVEEFAKRMAAFMAQFRQGLDTGDLPLLEKLAHQLRGAGGGYGYPLITKVAGQLETAVKQRDAVDDVIQKTAEELIQLCARARSGVGP